MGLGGNNGLTDFKDILGFPVQARSTRAALFALSALALAGGYLLCRASSYRSSAKSSSPSATPRAGPGFSATGSRTTSLRSSRFRPCSRASPAPSTCRRSASSIRASSLPANSIEVVIWVAVGGRATLAGAALGALVVNAARRGSPARSRNSGSSRLAGSSSSSPCSCRRGSSGRPWSSSAGCGQAFPRRRGRPDRRCRIRRSSSMQQTITPILLYLDNVTVSFDGFRALNALSLAIDHAEMRAIIGPNGAGKTTMMDVITGKTRPAKGTALFEGTHDLDRGSTRPRSRTRHRTEIPDADRLRHAHRRGQSPPRPQVGPAASSALFSRADTARAGADRRASRTHPPEGPPPSRGCRTLAWTEAVAGNRHAPGTGARNCCSSTNLRPG